MQGTAAVGERSAREGAARPATICEAFQARVAAHPDRVALRTRGDETSLTWRELGERVRHMAAGLHELGLRRGDALALMLLNRPEFHVVDIAAMHLGLLPFSIYNTSSPEQIAFLAGDAEARVVVCEADFAERVRAAGTGAEHVITVDELDALEARGEGSDLDFDAAWRAVGPDDLLTLIYTSGTTGNPKGVQITHRNMVATSLGYDEIIHFPDAGRVVSYLPMAHIAERNCSLYYPSMFGMTVTCCPDARQVVSYFPDVRPSWFFAVPRIFEKLKAAIEAGADDALRAVIDRGLRRVRGEEGVGEEEADARMLAGLRAKLGLDALESLNVGAAPTPPEVIEFFHALGLPLGELWGMSETTGAGACNRPGEIRIGTVGPAIPGVELRLAEDGELLVRGDCVTPGYRNDPERTRETFTGDGWLKTGDIAEIDDDGHVRIVDRKKELIINAGGKNMSPANIESKLKAASTVIGQAVAIGDRRPYNVALIVLDPDGAPAFARAHGLEDRPVAELAREPALLEEVQSAVDRANEQLNNVERIKRFKVLPADWEPGGDELTPTMKLKRRPIGEKYGREIDGLYA